MVSSMTAFASRQFSLAEGTLRWDIKSVNQRYFEASIKLPDAFQDLEYNLRDNLRRTISRGKIYCYLQYEEKSSTSAQLNINYSLLDTLIETSSSVATRLKNAAAISPLDLLKWPQVVIESRPDLAAVKKEISKAFSETLQDFKEARKKEGQELKGFMIQRLTTMDEILKKNRERFPSIISAYRERLMTKMLEMKVQVDSNRLEQEMIYIAQKTDVAEELDRLDTHLQAARNLLETGGVIGRHLDFLSQELNREANTLASKSMDALLTQEMVELKVLIEQIREQVQNIE
jgi:uncharacterized protein (TIGR00255 family)